MASSPLRRFIKRLLVLAAIAVFTGYLQRIYERDDLLALLLLELGVYAVMLFVVLNQQTGRLKAGPDRGRVSLETLFEEDPGVRFYVALYLFLLMLGIVGRVVLVGPLEGNVPSPWQLFMVFVPVFLIVYWRQYRLERRGNRS